MAAPGGLSWSADGTSPAEIADAMRRLLIACYGQSPDCVPARVLNLVCVVDKPMSAAVSERLQQAGRYHPSRTIVCAVDPGRTTLRAVASLGPAPHRDRDGVEVLHEVVTVDLGERHLPHLHAILVPLVVTDLPTVLWCPAGHDEAVELLLPLAQVVLLDSSDHLDPKHALDYAHDLLDSAYVVDLAWLRSTPWRERVAAAFDPPVLRDDLYAISAVSIRHDPESTIAGLLLLGWLGSRLDWQLGPLAAHNGGLAGTARRGGDDIRLSLTAEAQQPVRGLAGVTVATSTGWEISLDRGRGGLYARERDPSGRERRWLVLGASRGEPGILGEGIRQALLRDPAFGPAVSAATALTGLP
jgi:glucose-6-phosphate dehydrogenase assembly protein OpcA